MRGSLFSTAALTAVVSLSSLASCAVNRPYVLDHNDQLKATWESKHAPVRITQLHKWPSTPDADIPLDCAWEAVQDRWTSNDWRCTFDMLDVMEVFYEDAAEGWIVCRCRDAPFTEAQMLADIGRLSVGIRQHVRYFMGFDSGMGGGTATQGNDVIAFQSSVLLYHHEAGHVIDQGNIYSGSGLFTLAMMADSCWVTEYAKDNGEKNPLHEHEVWAEVFTLHVYRKKVGKLPVSVGCASNQFWALADQTDRIIDEGFNPGLKRPRGAMVKRREFEISALAARGTSMARRGVKEDGKEVCNKYHP